MIVYRLWLNILHAFFTIIEIIVLQSVLSLAPLLFLYSTFQFSSFYLAKPKHIFRIAFEVRTQRFLSSSSPSNSTSTTMASSSALTKPKSEMTPEELEAKEQQEFNTGPLSVLTESVKGNTQVPILTSVLRFTMIIQLVKLTCHHIDV